MILYRPLAGFIKKPSLNKKVKANLTVDGNWGTNTVNAVNKYRKQQGYELANGVIGSEVYKTLFSKEPIVFEDMCETKSVSTALYLDMNEQLPDDEHDYQFIGKVSSFCPIKPGWGGG